VANLILVFFGGALGSVARYAVATWAAQTFGPDLPRGTFLVNLAGSFLIALVIGLAMGSGAVSPGVRLFLTTGIMGGFTTYSSFNYETLHFLEEGAVAYAVVYVAATVGGCLVAGAIGLVTAHVIARAGTGQAV
jgi:CrcB protein